MSDWPLEWRTSTPGAMCPSCHTPTGRPILYGLPSPGVFAAQEGGDIDIVLAGCIIWGDDPAYHCRGCGQDFGSREVRPS